MPTTHSKGNPNTSISYVGAYFQLVNCLIDFYNFISYGDTKIYHFSVSSGSASYGDAYLSFFVGAGAYKVELLL